MSDSKKKLKHFAFHMLSDRTTTEIKNLIMTKPVKTLGLRPLWLIREFSKPAQIWRTTCTPSTQAMRDSKWMNDFWWSAPCRRSPFPGPHEEDSLLEWLSDRLILGPPRARSERELAEMDEDYLTSEEFQTHYVPWMKTWPHPDDHSWCTGPYRTTLPDWVISEYNATN